MLGSLAVTGLLFLSERWRWFGFNEHKGWTVLIAVAAVGVVLASMLLWFAVALVFRWRFQFGIRTLLVLMVAVALPCGWLATKAREAKSQGYAVRALRERGREILYDYQITEEGEWPEEEAPEWKWLRGILEDDFFHDVNLARIDDLPNHRLGEAGLKTPLVTGQGDLLHLCKLPRLKSLYIGECLALDDESLESLKGLDQLEILSISCANITDDALIHLHGLTQLRELYIGNAIGCPPISGAGLRHLRRLACLKRLYIFVTVGNPPDNSSLVSLGDLKQLESLVLISDMEDDGLKYVAGLVQLRELRVYSPQITDSGLQHLRRLSNLHSLDLTGDYVTDDGVKALREAIPRCKIIMR